MLGVRWSRKVSRTRFHNLCSRRKLVLLRYEWYKNGVKLFIDGKRIVWLNGTGSIVFLRPLDRDQGYYQCRAINIFGVAVSNMFEVKLGSKKWYWPWAKLWLAKHAKASAISERNHCTKFSLTKAIRWHCRATNLGERQSRRCSGCSVALTRASTSRALTGNTSQVRGAPGSRLLSPWKRAQWTATGTCSSRMWRPTTVDPTWSTSALPPAPCCTASTSQATNSNSP